MVNAPYAMSKAAVESFVRSLRAEMAGTGMTAGVLYPGWVSTPIIVVSHTNPYTQELLRRPTPAPTPSPSLLNASPRPSSAESGPAAAASSAPGAGFPSPLPAGS